MSSFQKEIIDPFYVRFYTQETDETLLDSMIQPIVNEFANQNYKTAITARKEGEHYCISCIAVRITKGQLPQAISKQVKPELLDGMKLHHTQEAEIEPVGIRFGKSLF